VNRWLVAVLAASSLGGCVLLEEDQLPAPVYYVDQTVEFWREPQGPGSYADCLDRPESLGCEYRLRLCDNGNYQILLGDVYTGGYYSMDRARTFASGQSSSGNSMTFDMTTLSSAEFPGDWMPVADAGILDCTGAY